MCKFYVGELQLQEKRQKRAAELKNLGPPQTASDAVKQMLGTKV